MSRVKVLVVDDERRVVELLRLYLGQEGYGVLTARDGVEALRVVREKQPDLLLLDLRLPQMDGLDVCRTLRKESDVPIIILTARDDAEDMLIGLESGADDYITKPFNPREVVARVRAVLRRSTDRDVQNGQRKRFGELTVDRRNREVRLSNEKIDLTPTEFALLNVLTGEPGRVFERSELLDRVLGADYVGMERTIDVHVMNLRRKIEPDPEHPRYIKTIYGLGYKFDDRTGSD